MFLPIKTLFFKKDGITERLPMYFWTDGGNLRIDRNESDISLVSRLRVIRDCVLSPLFEAAVFGFVSLY